MQDNVELLWSGIKLCNVLIYSYGVTRNRFSSFTIFHTLQLKCGIINPHII